MDRNVKGKKENVLIVLFFLDLTITTIIEMKEKKPRNHNLWEMEILLW